jgi:hypothetical protein
MTNIGSWWPSSFARSTSGRIHHPGTGGQEYRAGAGRGGHSGMGTGDDPVLLILPADHHIPVADQFQRVVKAGHATTPRRAD